MHVTYFKELQVLVYLKIEVGILVTMWENPCIGML